MYDMSLIHIWFLRPVVIGAVVGALCCTLVLIIMAAIVASQDIPKAVITPMAIVAGAAGSFFGGFTAARIAKERGLLIGGACGLLLFILVAVSYTHLDVYKRQP